MSADVGATVIHVLEEAGQRYLRDVAPDVYQNFILQIGGTDAVRAYEGMPAYWQRVQAILDCFFTAAERAEVVGRLIYRADLCRRPEFRSFMLHGLAERRLRVMIEQAVPGYVQLTSNRPIPIVKGD